MENATETPSPAFTLIPFTAFPRWVQKRFGLPRKPHLSTAYRWNERGVDGLRLNVIKVAGRRYVDPRDAEAFFAAVREHEQQPVGAA